MRPCCDPAATLLLLLTDRAATLLLLTGPAATLLDCVVGGVVQRISDPMIAGVYRGQAEVSPAVLYARD